MPVIIDDTTDGGSIDPKDTSDEGSSGGGSSEGDSKGGGSSGGPVARSKCSIKSVY